MEITKDKTQEWIELYKDSIKNFESRGVRGSKRDFEHLARCELLLGDIKKAREYFEESDKSWLWYLDHNRDYIKRKWGPHTHLSCYKDRMLIIFFAYGYERARDYVNSNLERIEKYSEENIRITNEEEYPGTSSDQIAYEKEILLHTYLMVKDTESASKLIKEIYDRFERSKRKTYKKGSKYPAVLHAKLRADVVNGIIEEDKDLFLNGLKELSELQEKLIDKIPVDYANFAMIFYSEMARQIWHDLAVDSLHIPEKLRSSSYFDELKKTGGTEE